MKQNGSSSKKNHNFLKNHLVVYSRISLRHSKKSKKKQKKVLEESLRCLLGNSTARSTEQLGLPMKNWGCKTPRTVSSFLLSKSPLIPTGLFGDSSLCQPTGLFSSLRCLWATPTLREVQQPQVKGHAGSVQPGDDPFVDLTASCLRGKVRV